MGMSDEKNGSNGKSRLDRLQALMELLIDDHLKFSDEHKKLLAAQVVLTDRLDRLAAAHEASKADFDERLNALIAVVDGLVRNRPQA